MHTWRFIACYIQDFTVCRVRLVCTLLETCGSFFCKGKAGRRLDRFLAYFQRYLLAKPPLPLDIDFDVQVCNLLAGTRRNLSFLDNCLSTVC
jgi:hypothetical protein